MKLFASVLAIGLAVTGCAATNSDSVLSQMVNGTYEEKYTPVEEILAERRARENAIKELEAQCDADKAKYLNRRDGKTYILESCTEARKYRYRSPQRKIRDLQSELYSECIEEQLESARMCRILFLDY